MSYLEMSHGWTIVREAIVEIVRRFEIGERGVNVVAFRVNRTREESILLREQLRICQKQFIKSRVLVFFGVEFTITNL